MFRKIAIAAALTTGLTHLAVAVGYYLHTPAQGIWLAVVGLCQVAWAVGYWHRPARLLLVGQSLLGGPFVLWGLTVIVSAPFVWRKMCAVCSFASFR